MRSMLVRVSGGGVGGPPGMMAIVTVDPEQPAEQIRQAKEEARRQVEQFRQAAQEPEQQREWIRQNNVIYGGLIAVGLVLVQPFLTATTLDRSAEICVVAFSAAIPLLAALVLVNHQESFRRRLTDSRLVRVTRSRSCWRFRRPGRRLLAHHVARRSGGLGQCRRGNGGPFRRLLPPGAGRPPGPRSRTAPGTSRTRCKAASLTPFAPIKDLLTRLEIKEC